MQDFLTRLFGQANDTIKDLSTSRKIAIVTLALVVMGGILGAAYFAGRPDNRVLFANLANDDAMAITQALTDRNVPYELASGGSAVLVPADRVLQLRLELASEGLPAGGSVGFEIFDKSTFGMTEFVQKINLKRALQGELERTIIQFREVSSARVHIARPQAKLFSKDAEATTASVMLKMNGHQALGKEQVLAIVHLVASSVEGLKSDNVTVVDVEGRVLYGGESDNAMARLSSTQLDYRSNVEKEIEKSVTSLLEPIIGMGKVVTRVSADLDFRQVERTEKKFDPASQVARSEQRNNQKSTGAQSPSGVPGVQSNLPGREGEADTGGKPASSTNTQETINYEINESVAHIIDPTGAVKRLSVAVLVDGKYEKKEGEAGKQYVPRTAEELTRIESLIRTAAGIDTNRGDVVTVQSAPFDTSSFDEAMEASATASSATLTADLIRYGGMGALALLLLFFVIRPVMGWITATSADLQQLQTFPQTVEQLENQLGLHQEGEEKVDYRTRVRHLIEADPKATAEMLREWLKARR
jgi:flagellar M-ring protein FliF